VTVFAVCACSEGHLGSSSVCRGAGSVRVANARSICCAGIGGDNSDGAVGTFYEGALTQGFSSNQTDAAVQANVVLAGYGN
jgi:hypothetical protein